MTELTSLARQIADTPDRRLGATRSIASALLLRQALEFELDGLWARVVPGMERCSARVQLIALPYYLDPSLAGQVSYCWHRLSSICHHHAYELPPPSIEVMHLASIVERLAASTAVAGERGAT